MPKIKKKSCQSRIKWSLKCKLKQEEMANVKAKKWTTYDYIRELQNAIERYSLEAETESDFNLLTKANSFRKTVTEKRELVKSLENVLANLEKEL